MDSYAINQEPPIHMNYDSAQEHVPRAEHNNRTIKEQVWCEYHNSPFDHLPRIMLKYMASEQARKLNYFPAQHEVSKHYSPCMILHQENIDYHHY
eukprot:71956-Ditylum_brightwellii.AAC.1